MIVLNQNGAEAEAEVEVEAVEETADVQADAVVIATHAIEDAAMDQADEMDAPEGDEDAAFDATQLAAGL